MTPNTNQVRILPALAGLASAGVELPSIVESFGPAQKAMHELNFRWRNQRQNRKRRRRANAAGMKGAFIRSIAASFSCWRTSKYKPHVGKKQLAKGIDRTMALA